MARTEQFEQSLDKIIEDYSDLTSEEIADSLEYYAEMYRRKAESD